MRRIVWATVYWLKGVLIGLRALRRVQLGSRVRHDGKWWFVSNWAGEPHMNLTGGATCDGPGEYRKHVPREEIQASRSLPELAHRFRTSRRWYMTNWFRIDVERRTLRC